MSIINNQFLSLSARIKLQQAQKKEQNKEVIQEEPKNEKSPSQKETPKTFVQPKKPLDNGFLLTYRGITINHMETAETKTSVTSSKPEILSTGSKEESKPVSVDKSIVSKSSLASAYRSGTSRVTSTGSFASGLNKAKNLAESDLKSLAATIKSQLKKELGANYDEKSIQEAVNKAIEQTIKEFTDNRTKKSRSYRAQTSDKGFVFSRTSILMRGKYSYNVQPLADTFIDNFNTISRVNFENVKKQQETQNAKLLETKTNLKKEQEKYAKKYMRSIPTALLYSFDKVYDSALNKINLQNYQNAQEVVEQFLDEKLNHVNGGSDSEIKSNADSLLAFTKEYYENKYSGIYEDNSFSKVFEEAKSEVLKNLDKSKECSAEAIVNNLDSQVRYLVNNYMDAQLEESTSSSAPMTRGVSTEPKIVTSLRDVPKEPDIKTIKGKNGATITVTNYSFYFRNTNIVQTMKDKDGIHYPNATIDITLPNGEKYSVNAGIENLNGYAKKNPDNQTPPISAIDKLAETLGSLQAGVLDSFCKEIHYVKIQDVNNTFAGMYTYDETMTITYRGEKRGEYGEVISPEINNINGYVITHELGHAIDYNKESSSQMKQFENTFNKIKNSKDYQKFVKDNIYALSDVNEFFAEYFTYKKYGTTSKQGQKVFKELEKDAQKNSEIKNLLDSMQKIISNTEKLSKEDRQSNKMSQYDIQAATEKAKKEAKAKKEEQTNNTNNNQNGHLLPPDHSDQTTPVNPPSPPVNPTPDKTENNKTDKEDAPVVKPPADTVNPDGNTETKTDKDENNKTQDKKPPKEPDTAPAPSTRPDNETPDTKPADNTVEHGKETYKPFDQKPGAEGIGNLPSTDAPTLSQQKAQELYEKYGDGYDINVNAVTNPDGTITVEYTVKKAGQGTNGAGNGTGNADGKLPDGPVGDITGNSGAGKTDSGNAPGLDGNGKIPVKDINGSNANSNSGIFEGVGIDINNYTNKDGLINVDKLMSDWQKNGGDVYNFSDANSIGSVLNAFNDANVSGDWNKFYDTVNGIADSVKGGNYYALSKLCELMDDFMNNTGGLTVQDKRFTSQIFNELKRAVSIVIAPGGGFSSNPNKLPPLNPNNVTLAGDEKKNNKTNVDSGFGKDDRPKDLDKKIPYNTPEVNTNNTNIKKFPNGSVKPKDDKVPNNSVKPKNEPTQSNVPKNNTNKGNSININKKPSSGSIGGTKRPSSSRRSGRLF